LEIFFQVWSVRGGSRWLEAMVGVIGGQWWWPAVVPFELKGWLM